jgi:hypothetical protein
MVIDPSRPVLWHGSAHYRRRLWLRPARHGLIPAVEKADARPACPHLSGIVCVLGVADAR